ncbi:hypothetical protein PLICRDRAFT_40733 [Plicaturopsis crispa FD-325 SS-3]|nr:hypothetical protein PLICRDRAFT_40733 [Plicaturopsis crispa FD-325 SS-3]
MPYKLSATLIAHSSDVRALSSPTDELILSASRDTTAISWVRPSPTSPFAPSSLLRAGTRYVNAVAYIPPSADAPKGYAVTGGQDTVINIFSLDSPSKEDPEFSLLGHTENVCALNVSAGGTIISGSWDKTAKVWKHFQLAYDLKGHQQSVWAVQAVDEDQFLTGSADKTIKLWQQHKLVNTYRGHTDAVRGLALIPDVGFASCSNDSEIRVWTFAGDLVHTLSGHTSFVYSLSVLPNGDIVSGGEDRTVRVWRDGECAQTIVHPAISVWAVSSMPNGDIVSGCSDHIVRVFSTAEERWATQEDLKTYEDQVAAQTLPSQQVGDVKKSDLPGPEVLTQPGKKEGEVKMVRNGDNVEAHQWVSATSSWQKIGDVVDAVGSGRKQLYEGKEYDYVFDVDIQDGVPPLKLPYNTTENPYGAAQRFLERNELPTTYVDEVVRFIEKNTAGVSLGNSNNDYVDPFTGASRYQSSAASVPVAGPASSYVDPYTGASRYSGAPAPTAQPSAPRILPVSKSVAFKQANVQAMQGKLYQFDETIRNEISIAHLAISPEERQIVDETFKYLAQAVASPAAAPPSPIGSAHLNAIVQILERWPAAQRFPVIDLSRLVIGYCPNAFPAAGVREQFLGALFKAAEWSAPWSVPVNKSRETNVLLLFRALSNAFLEGAPVGEGAWVKQVLESLGDAPYELLNKTQRVALATVLFNFSCLNLGYPVQPDIRTAHLTLSLGILRAERSDSEAVYRVLVAVGNIVYAAKSHGVPLESAQTAEIRQLIGPLPGSWPEVRIRDVSGEISGLL